MRLAFDNAILSAIGLSALCLVPISLQFVRMSAGSEGIYPIRMKLPQISLAGANSGEIASGSNNPAAESGKFSGSDAVQIEAAPEERPTVQKENGKFAAAFQDLGQTKSATRDARAFGNMLAIEYDLTALAGSSDGMHLQSSKALAGTMDVRKRIKVGKADPTRIDVKVGNGANIYLNAAQLSSMLQAQGKTLKATSATNPDGFVSLDDLRDNGFKVRYDATGDALIVDSDV